MSGYLMMAAQLRNERQRLRVWWALEGQHKTYGASVFVGWALKIQSLERQIMEVIE